MSRRPPPTLLHFRTRKQGILHSILFFGCTSGGLHSQLLAVTLLSARPFPLLCSVPLTQVIIQDQITHATHTGGRSTGRRERGKEVIGPLLERFCTAVSMTQLPVKTRRTGKKVKETGV